MITVRGTQPEMPLELDFESSPTTIYLRYNIRRVEEENNGKIISMWEYEEEEFEKTDENIALVSKKFIDQKNAEFEHLSAYYVSTQAVLPNGGE